MHGDLRPWVPKNARPFSIGDEVWVLASPECCGWLHERDRCSRGVIVDIVEGPNDSATHPKPYNYPDGHDYIVEYERFKLWDVEFVPREPVAPSEMMLVGGIDGCA